MMDNQRSARSSRGTAFSATAIALGIVAVLAIGASGVLGRPAASPSPSPSTPPSAPPSVEPSTPPSAPPIGGIKVLLDIASAHTVHVVVDDATGALVKAESGKAADGMSVRWLDAKVENLDDRTIRLTWVGLLVDDEVDGEYRIKIVQAGPYPNTDALGADRVLVLTFDEPVSSDDVTVAFEYQQG